MKLKYIISRNSVSIIGLLLIKVYAFSQVENSSVTFDHSGNNELTEEEIRDLFEEEERLYRLAREIDSEIFVIPSEKFGDVFVKKESKIEETIIIDSLIGKKYSQIAKIIDHLSPNDFMLYYKMLDKKDKRLFLLSSIGDSCRAALNDVDVQKFLLKEYERIKKVENTRNKVQLIKIKFLQDYKVPGSIDSTIVFLENARVADLSYLNDELIIYLFKGSEKLAFSSYEKLVDRTIAYKQKNPENQSYLIPMDNKRLFQLFLNAKSMKVRQAFINHSIKIIEEDVFNPKTLSHLMYCLWFSRAMDKSQIERFLLALEKSKYNYSINLLKYFKSSSKGVNYIIQLPSKYIKDSLALDDLSRIVEYGIPSYDRQKLLKFIKDNEEYLRKNTYCYECTFDNIMDKLNSRSNNRTIDSLFQIITPDFRVDSIDLVNEYIKWNIYSPSNEERSMSTSFVLNYYLKQNFPQIHFDTEAGMVPLDYDKLLKRFGELMRKELIGRIRVKQLSKEYDESYDDYEKIMYSIYIGVESQNIYNVKLPNSGDWYSVSPLIKTLNLIIKDNGSARRWINMETGDQTSRYILMSPSDYRLLKPFMKL